MRFLLLAKTPEPLINFEPKVKVPKDSLAQFPMGNFMLEQAWSMLAKILTNFAGKIAQPWWKVRVTCFMV